MCTELVAQRPPSRVTKPSVVEWDTATECTLLWACSLQWGKSSEKPKKMYKNMKKCSTLFVFRKLQVKTRLLECLSPPKLTIPNAMRMLNN
jgi:hypothetical protein